MPSIATTRSPARMPARSAGLFADDISTRPAPSFGARLLVLRMKIAPVHPRASHVRRTPIVHAAAAARKMTVKVRPIAIRRAGLMTMYYVRQPLRLWRTTTSQVVAYSQVVGGQAESLSYTLVPLAAAVRDGHE